MPESIVNKYVVNKVATPKELQDFKRSQGKAKRAAFATTLSVGLIGSVVTSNIASKLGRNVAAIEHTVTAPKTKDVVIASADTYSKEAYKGKEKVATVLQSEENKMSKTMDRPVESSSITKVSTAGVKNGEFDPYVTYYTDKGAKAYAPDNGKVVKKDGDTIIIEHQNSDLKYDSVIEGVKSDVKVNQNVKKDQVLGNITGGVLKFSVAKKVDKSEVTGFIHPNLLVDINKSDSLDYKTGKVDLQKELAAKASDVLNKVAVASNAKPSLTNSATQSEKKVVKELPYGNEIISASEKHDVDPVLVAGLIKQESGYDSKAESQSGAKGLMQLMPDTAGSFGVNDVLDPKQNLDAGVTFLKSLIKKYKDPELALYAYNAGPGNVDKWLKEGLSPSEFPFKETRDYGPKILDNYKKLKEKAQTIDPSAAYKDQIAAIDNQYKEPVSFGDLSGKLKGLKIGVDAGHYPAAPGATSWDGKTSELAVNRTIKDAVVAKLKEAGATVVDSEGDVKSLGPGQRANVFDNNNVDLAVSFHNNSSTTLSVSGSETLFEQGVPESEKLAQDIQNNIGKAISTTQNRGIVGRDNLGIFTEGKTVTALVETGFVSNPYDLSLLENKTVIENISNAVVKGLEDYVEQNNLSKENTDTKSESNKTQDSSQDNKNSNSSLDNTKSEDKKPSDSNQKVDSKSDEKVDIQTPPVNSDNKTQSTDQTSQQNTNKTDSVETNTNKETVSEQKPVQNEDNKKSSDKTTQNFTDEVHSFIFNKFFK